MYLFRVIIPMSKMRKVAASTLAGNECVKSQTEKKILGKPQKRPGHHEKSTFFEALKSPQKMWQLSSKGEWQWQ